MLLLRACLCKGEEGLSAWRQWSKSVNLDEIEPDSCRLLPLLYTKLAAQRIQHPWMGRMKGYHRFLWVRNAGLLAIASDLVKCLRDIAGDDQILLKGAGIACSHYPNIGLRAMLDLDLMIRAPAVPQAWKHLRAHGWEPLQVRSEQTFPRYLRFTHAMAFLRNREKLDLHWDLLDDLNGSAVHETFWQASEETQLPDGTPVKVLCVADQLFQTCLHGVRADQGPNPRWITDAATLIGHMRDEDWLRLRSVAKERRYTLRIGKALEFLAENFGESLPIPRAVVPELLEQPHSLLEQSELDRRIDPVKTRNRTTLEAYREFLLHSQPPEILKGGFVTDFLGFLMTRWNLAHPILVPVTLASRAMRKIWRIGKRSEK